MTGSKTKVKGNGGCSTNGAHISDEWMRKFDRQFLREAAAFRRQLPKLLKRYSGQFIAMSDGRVVGHDPDVEKLRERIRAQQDFTKAILVKRVSEEEDPVVEMDAIGF